MFLLYHRSVSVTGRAIASALGIGSGRENSNALAPMIRWGSAIRHPADTALNQREAILKASDKLRAFQTMQEAGVPVPRFTTRYEDTSEGTWMGRRKHGSKGTDIVVIPSMFPHVALTSDFYTEYVPNTREYRVHVFRGEVIRVQGKYLDHPDMQENPFIKNHAQGYRFRAPRKMPHSRRLDAAKLAVSCLGLDFGAVDLLVGEDGNTYVLEVNTAPACSPLTAHGYVQKFAEVLGVTPDYTALGRLGVDKED